ncbi:MAG: hypothetical protein U0836_16690 [Pirellulales bacterium]
MRFVEAPAPVVSGDAQQFDAGLADAYVVVTDIPHAPAFRANAVAGVVAADESADRVVVLCRLLI